MGDSSGSDSGSLLSEDFIGVPSDKFSEIKKIYGALLVNAQDTAGAEASSLYEVGTEIRESKLLQRQDVLFVALALALGGLMAVIITLLTPKRPVS